jgi:hypothetical protein
VGAIRAKYDKMILDGLKIATGVWESSLKRPGNHQFWSFVRWFARNVGAQRLESHQSSRLFLLLVVGQPNSRRTAKAELVDDPVESMGKKVADDYWVEATGPILLDTLNFVLSRRDKSGFMTFGRRGSATQDHWHPKGMD